MQVGTVNSVDKVWLAEIACSVNIYLLITYNDFFRLKAKLDECTENPASMAFRVPKKSS
jgi:hypothetical protein